MEQLNQKMALYKLDCAEGFLWDTKLELDKYPVLLIKVKGIIDELFALRATIRGINDENEPYEKSEKDCMWEGE